MFSTPRSASSGVRRGCCAARVGGGGLASYVNDWPYAVSSLLSVAIARVLGSALQGRSKYRPELAATPMVLSARIDVLFVRGGERFLRRLFEPLGYTVRFLAVGPEDNKRGPPTQMGVFEAVQGQPGSA